MKTLRYLFFLGFILISCQQPEKHKILDFQTPYENSSELETATYEDIIAFYIQLAKKFPEINVQTLGETDSGYPLHLVSYNPDGDFNFQKISKKKAIILINNGIHPGESDGIDATMLFFRDLALKKITAPEHTVLVTIPVYNIGGALHRNSTTRVNQNGPESYGFRGNAQNYDLNRDFIKTDTKNTETFAAIFHLVKPDIFLDNHVSNGANYQYTLSHLFTQHNKLGGSLGAYLYQHFTPALERTLAENNWDITPYVNVHNTVPEQGFSQFMDYPRYSTGYTTLWNTIGLMAETHMLKPYANRVRGTYQLMVALMHITENDFENIKSLRAEAHEAYSDAEKYPLRWSLDTTQTTSLPFKGYKADIRPSEITGFPRIRYDTTQPFCKEITYSNFFSPTHTVRVPQSYIIKKGWRNVLRLLQLNHISYHTLPKDTTLTVESYRILNYKTMKNPYEGHYPHYDTEVAKSIKNVAFQQGDIVVPTRQSGIRYLLETLEPEATDSFFNWNFFDAILQQKEHFSPYVFEDLAVALLRNDTLLNTAFVTNKEIDTAFAQNPMSQLQWIYERSPYYEAAHLQYPVFRVPNDTTPTP
ncbi:M14 family metallopeptidase [Arenibacter sp. GZD96]|uniref:M14 family metallopeptidase n=1 Tax=Aurantibrevibacter litoralis TaxID=3106030 RepID=UPI002AFEB0ED|nr:M14 family metallopeptidase [Arenibacter sp. GZD-96]MEA1786846.1 M14 family metallopeptidase [Arenibacter sp. GZD-96]